MLADSLRANPAPLTIIEVRSTAVKDRLRALGFPDSRIQVFDCGPEQPVPTFTACGAMRPAPISCVGSAPRMS